MSFEVSGLSRSVDDLLAELGPSSPMEREESGNETIVEDRRENVIVIESGRNIVCLSLHSAVCSRWF